MNRKLAQKFNQKGFTLIELLIVIVIIGILAGIVITILNPARQQNRARDGVVVATINKINADVKAYAAADISGALALPTCGQLVSSLNNATVGAGCAGASTPGNFTITGVTNSAGVLEVFTYDRSAVAGSQNFCISAPANDNSAFSGAASYIVYGLHQGSGVNYAVPTRVQTACTDIP